MDVSLLLITYLVGAVLNFFGLLRRGGKARSLSVARSAAWPFSPVPLVEALYDLVHWAWQEPRHRSFNLVPLALVIEALNRLHRSTKPAKPVAAPTGLADLVALCTKLRDIVERAEQLGYVEVRLMIPPKHGLVGNDPAESSKGVS